MKILIIGGGGMLGHQLWRYLCNKHETWVTLRHPSAAYLKHGLFHDGRVFPGVDATDTVQIADVITRLKPDAVLNCVGIVKQLKEARHPLQSLMVNSVLPHRLAETCGRTGSRLVLFSTDCVFSGRRGKYKETDISDAEDLYGRSKFLGEVNDLPHVITVRSSIVGREVGSAHSLVEWFLAQKCDRIRGFRRAIYSGITTIEMARIVESVLMQHTQLSGVWQVASEPISKYDLLQLVRTSFDFSVEIEADDSFICDRSLDGSRFGIATGYRSPSWRSMVEEMAANSIEGPRSD